MMKRLPRAPSADPVVIAGDLWNRIATAVESAVGLTVDAPLHMEETPAGRAITLVGEFDQGVSFKISSIVTSQIGRYNAKTFSGTIPDTVSGNLQDSDIGTLASSDDAIVWHVPEIALASAKHMLKTGVTYVGRKVGKNSDGTTIILFGVLPIGETTSPSAPAGSGATADSTDWSRQTNGTPVTFSIVSRVFYDTSTHVLSMFQRSLAFDAAGILTIVSAETKTTIDTAVTCA